MPKQKRKPGKLGKVIQAALKNLLTVLLLITRIITTAHWIVVVVIAWFF